MKSLDEKKLLVNMSRILGQPVDQELIESINREEQLAEVFFKETAKPKPIQILKEQPKNQTVQILKQNTNNFTNKVDTLVNQVVESISNNAIQSTELQAQSAGLLDELNLLKKTVQAISQKLTFNGMGGGGTGVVRIGDTDDFDKYSYSDGRYLRWKDGMFRLDELTAGDVINNTILVNTEEYYVLETDWYIGVQYPGICTIHLPVSTSNGRNLVIKDESGNCGNNPIIITGTIDNDVGGVNLQINNGAIHMVYRSGWRII